MTRGRARYDLDETTYAQAATVADDVIVEQSETDYDAASNVIQATARQRYHNAPASQTGTLGDPSTDPKARVKRVGADSGGAGQADPFMQTHFLQQIQGGQQIGSIENEMKCKTQYLASSAGLPESAGNPNACSQNLPGRGR